jgi:hypothetical protein
VHRNNAVIVIVIHSHYLFVNIHVPSSIASGELHNPHEYETATTTTIKQEQRQNKQTKVIESVKVFAFKCKFMKISVNLQIALAAEVCLAEGQWLEEQLNVHVFEVETQITTVSKEG